MCYANFAQIGQKSSASPETELPVRSIRFNRSSSIALKQWSDKKYSANMEPIRSRQNLRSDPDLPGFSLSLICDDSALNEERS